MNFTEENLVPGKKRAPRPKKRGNARGVTEWIDLDTAADVKRFFRWLEQSMRDGTLRAIDCHAMRLVGESLLKAIDATDIEEKIVELSERYERLYEQHQAMQKNGFRGRVQ